MRYPEAPRLDLVEDLHGHRVADPYRWLEDDADPRTRAWSEAEDALAAELLSALPMRPDLASRLDELVHAGASASRCGAAAGASPRAATQTRSTRSCGSASRTAPSASWSTRPT